MPIPIPLEHPRHQTHRTNARNMERSNEADLIVQITDPYYSTVESLQELGWMLVQMLRFRQLEVDGVRSQNQLKNDKIEVLEDQVQKPLFEVGQKDE